MTVTAVLIGLCALVVLVLAYRVGRLSAQVRQLSSDLAAVSARPSPSPSPPSPVEAMSAAPEVEVAPAVEAAPTVEVAPAVEAALDEEVPVPVITVMSDADDEVDITARRVASVTLARPLIKVASLSYGIRHALDDERRFKVRYAMRQELRRQRKMRRRRRAGREPSMGWRS